MILADLMLHALFATHPSVYGAAFLIVLILAFLAAWLLFRRPLERRRIYQRAQRLLHDGEWEAALMTIRALEETGPLAELWQGRLRNMEGECRQKAAEAALREQRYEEALEHFCAASALLKSAPDEDRMRVVETMLAEVRRRFAAWPKENVASCLGLTQRVQLMQSDHAEALFWKGLCLVREEQWEVAISALRTSHEAGSKKHLDPALYLGILLCRSGQAEEAIRYLAEANRIDSSCPLVTWQLGVAMVAADGDSALAVRALQRAVGARGLSAWLKRADRVWRDGFPENRSYVRRLAVRHTYACPLLGNDLAAMLRQAQMGLAQAYYRNGNFEEAAGLYGKLLQECPPTTVLLRGLGLSLTRLERYDEAFKHLRTAFEQESPKNHLTAGYLALCGALGKPTQEGDKLKNLDWAIRLLARFQAPSDTEWANLYSRVFAEARSVQMRVAVEDQVRLCDALASVHAVDPLAAAAYDQLAADSPSDVQPRHAWLYCQAAVTHGLAGNQDIELFARTVREAEAAGQYFAERGWCFDTIEYACLERNASRQPGRYPESLGLEYPRRGEAFLLTRSRNLEDAGHIEGAMACVELLHKLDPRSAVAHDRLARLAYRRGELDHAAELLAGWEALEPENPWAPIRRAIIEQEREQPCRRAQAIDEALHRMQGKDRVFVAYLGARLALREARKPGGDTSRETERAEQLLQFALRDDPTHVEALCCLAALRAVAGRFPELAELAPRMSRSDVADARYHLLASACYLAAGDGDASVLAAQRSVGDAALAAEACYLMGLACLRKGDDGAAAAAFRAVTNSPTSAALDEARALLGQISLGQDNADEAIRWWSAVDPEKRQEWRLDRPLQELVYLAGIHACRAGNWQDAASRLVEARWLGCEDGRLMRLLPLVLLNAGQQLLFRENPPATMPRNLDPHSNGQAHKTESEYASRITG